MKSRSLMRTPFQLDGTRIRYGVPFGSVPPCSVNVTWAVVVSGEAIAPTTAVIITAVSHQVLTPFIRTGPSCSSDMGGPDMAPHPPQAFGAPRRSRGAPL